MQSFETSQHFAFCSLVIPYTTFVLSVRSSSMPSLKVLFKSSSSFIFAWGTFKKKKSEKFPKKSKLTDISWDVKENLVQCKSTQQLREFKKEQVP